MPYVPLIVAFFCAVFWYHAGRQEMDSGVLWFGISLIVSFAMIYLAGAGSIGVLLGQIGLLAGITLFRTWRDKDGV
jgi:hypothetical protein